ncbi:CvpA family protein [Candidatus Puniceispirillum sp.]|nr:CvpA family protein [Candidatus Puniceispirillum sp.]
MIDFTSLTLIDYGIFFILLLSALLSILRGLTREILGLVGWVVSFFVANYSQPLIKDPIIDLLQVKGLGEAIAWGLPFGASVVVWFISASLIAPGLKRVGLGSFDRWLGVLFGFTRGYGLVLIVFMIAVSLQGEDNLPKSIKGSLSRPLLSLSAHYFASFVPDDHRDQIINNLTYRAPIKLDTLTDKVKTPQFIRKQNESTSMKLLNDEKVN